MQQEQRSGPRLNRFDLGFFYPGVPRSMYAMAVHLAVHWSLITARCVRCPRACACALFAASSATGVAWHRPGERQTIGSVASRADRGLGRDGFPDRRPGRAARHLPASDVRRAGTTLRSPRRRYCSASELDLMVRLVGLRMRERHQDWDRGPFTGASRDHISACEVTAAPAG